MRRKLIVGNWKMNFTLSEAVACVETFIKVVDQTTEVDVGLAPTYIAIHHISHLLEKHKVMVGGQDVFWLDKGAFTGRVSPTMLKDVGATFCIIGHSEPRGRFGKSEIPESLLYSFSETDATVNLKLKALLFNTLLPILCVGETEDERKAGDTQLVIGRQLSGALEGLVEEEASQIVIAYEPVWAIGTGMVCDSDEANSVCGFIRNWLKENVSAEAAESVRILYGGSVKSGNAKELFQKSEIDGALVGGASLDAHEFAKIIEAAAL